MISDFLLSFVASRKTSKKQNTMLPKQFDKWLIPISFLIVYVVWGTTYLANAWGVKVVPPFIFSGIRFLISGSVLLLLTSFFQPVKITWAQFKNLFLAGLLLFGIGNGFVTWALQYVDSGITALMVAFEPLLVALLLWQLKKQKPQMNTWIGITLGIVGMVLLVGQPQFVSSWNWLIGVAFIFIAISSWAYVSIWISSVDLPESVLQSAAWQMLIGGVILSISSFFIGEFEVFDWEKIDNKVIWSWVYLIVFGAIFAFSAFNYLLQKVSPTKVVASAYVHPVIALLLGWKLNSEVISTQSILAAAILILGVYFINKDKSESK